MTTRRTLSLLLVGGLLAGLAGYAGRAAAGDKGDGEALVRQAWKLMKANDVKAVGELMAPGFQSAHADGARDKAAELKLIAGLKLGDYELTGFRSTRSGATLVVTYQVAVSETIDGKRRDKKPAARMSVFSRIDGTWKWVAHANLRAL